MAVLEFANLSKRFGATVAVRQLSFAVEAGRVVGFLGPNGAGKTTTLRILLGLVAADEGRATINGKHYLDLPDPMRHVGAVLEASSFHPGRSARNHLLVQATAVGINASRVDEMLEFVELGDSAHRRVGGFSLGMRQRLSIAAAMLGSPDILILDEPANGLDPEGVRWLRDFVRQFAEEGGTVLVSSHILAEVAQTVDEVVIIDRGRLITQSPLAQLVSGRRQVVRVRTSQPKKLTDALNHGRTKVRRVSRGTLEITGATPERVGKLAAKLQVPTFEITTQPATLEEVFFRLTGSQSEASE